MRYYLPLLLLLVFTSFSFAADYTLSPDGSYVWVDNANALVNCTATSHELIEQETVCTFQYKGTSAITLNSSIVFNLADGVKPTGVAVWQNISHTLYHYVMTLENHSKTINQPVSITTTTGACDWGNGTIKRNVTESIEGQPYSLVYCFDSFINNSNNYTLYSAFYTPVSTPYTSYFYDWNDISSQFSISQFGSYKVGTIEASWTPGQTRLVKFSYDTRPNSDGKFDIYFHLKSVQEAKVNPSNIKMALDPWWSSGGNWNNRKCQNITASSGATYYFNVTLWDTSAHPEIRFTTNSTGTEAQCGSWWQVKNETGGRWILNCSLATGKTSICGYYNNNTVVSDLADIQTACSLGDDFPGSSVNATNWISAGSPAVSGSIITITGTADEAVVSKKQFGINSVFEAYISAAMGATTITGAAGFCSGATPCSAPVSPSYNVSWIRIKDSTEAARLYTADTDSDGYLDLPDTFTGYYNYKVTKGTSNVSAYRNHAYEGSRSADIPQTSLNATIAIEAATASFASDWVCVYDNTGSTGYAMTFTAWGAAETKNAAPYVVSVNTTPLAPTDENDLNCSFRIDDADSTPLNITGYWYKNGAIQNSLNFSLTSVVANTTNWSILGDGNTTPGEDWGCAVNATDGTDSSALNFSANVTIATGITIGLSAGSTYETENSSIQITLTPIASASSYNITVEYNNTLVLTATISGNGTDPRYYTAYAVAPLVASNNTNIPYRVNASAVINSELTTSTNSDDHVVKTWYIDMTQYAMTAAEEYTVEDQNNVSVESPDRPALATADVSYTPTYGFSNCTEYYANGTATNTTTCNTTISIISRIDYAIPASHKSAAGLIYQDYYVNRSYVLGFSQTPESTSSKGGISDTDTNMSREYFVWLTNRTNGTINNASNMSNVFYVRFYDEETLTNISIDSLVATYTVDFPDSETKMFTISYTSVGALQNSTIRGYPDFYNASISSIEQYSKASYRTTSRFMDEAETPLDTQQNISVYLLSSSNATYVIINVIDRGDAVPSAVVSILKYYSGTGVYTVVEEKTTNGEGRTAAYLDITGYYKFSISVDGEDAYFSPGPEQFICDPTCELTIDISDQIPISLLSPQANAVCYGVNATNSITFNYADATGLTSSINFLAYRENVSAPVCNYTVSASSSSYVCTLGGGENLSQYLYSCEVWHSASPPALDYVDLIDFRLFIGIVDWVMPALVLITTLGVSAAHLPLGIGLGSIALFAMSIMGIIAIPVGTSMPIMIVGLVIAFYLSKRGAD